MADSALDVVQDIRSCSPFPTNRENRVPTGTWLLLCDTQSEGIYLLHHDFARSLRLGTEFAARHLAPTAGVSS